MPFLLAAVVAHVAIVDVLPQRPELVAASYPDGVVAAVEPPSQPNLACLVVGAPVGSSVLPGGLTLDLVPQGFGAPVLVGPGLPSARLAVPAGPGLVIPLAAQAVLLDVGSGALTVSEPASLVSVAPSDTAEIVVLFGQSNGEGAVPIQELPDALRREQPFVRVWNDATRSWEPLLAGHNGSSYVSAPWCGPEMGIALAAERERRRVWLVKLAVGPSSLGPTAGAWSEWHPESGELYTELVQRLERSCAAARALGLVPRVRSLCFVQGESDALDSGLAAGYGPRLRCLVRQLRKDLGDRGLAVGSPRFLAVLVDRRLSQVGFPAVADVRAAQAEVMSSEVCCGAFEPSLLPMRPDRVHFALRTVIAIGNAALPYGE